MKTYEVIISFENRPNFIKVFSADLEVEHSLIREQARMSRYLDELNKSNFITISNTELVPTRYITSIKVVEK